MTTLGRFSAARRWPYIAFVASILILVVATLGFRVIPRAAAATINLEEEVGDILVQVTDNNLIGFTVKSERFRYEDDLGAGPQDYTVEKAIVAMDEERQALKNTLGWDVESRADQQSFQDELRKLRVALGTIINSPNVDPDRLKVSKALRKIIDLFFEVQCRGRCVPEGDDAVLAQNVISAAAVGTAMAAMMTELLAADLPQDFVETVIMACGIAGFSMALVAYEVIFRIFGEGSTRAIRTVSTVAAGALFIRIHQYAEEQRRLAAQYEKRIQDLMRDWAKAVADATPAADDKPAEIDIVHDEF